MYNYYEFLAVVIVVEIFINNNKVCLLFNSRKINKKLFAIPID